MERQRNSDFVATNDFLPSDPMEDSSEPFEPTYFPDIQHSQNIDSTEPFEPTYYPDIQYSQNEDSIPSPPSFFEATE